MTTYDLPLTDWITIGLLKDPLAQAAKQIQAGEPLAFDNLPDNTQYFSKVLKGAAKNQFSDMNRPLLEIVLNSVDAHIESEDPSLEVQLKVGLGKFTAKDNGKGMSLERILTKFVMPWETDKADTDQIGTYGTGFLSVLNYLTTDPENARVIAHTSTGEEAYKVELYATDTSIDNINMRITPKVPGKAGTTIQLHKLPNSKKNIVGYLKQNLKTMPSYIATITLNRKPVNDANQIWTRAPVDLSYNDDEEKTVTQEVGLHIKPRSRLDLLSQGVPVKRTSWEGALISFPSAVSLVRGRDAFKKDSNYKLASKKVFDAFEKYVASEHCDERTLALFWIARQIAGALHLDSSEITNLDKIAKTIAPDATYMIDPHQARALGGFLGTHLKDCTEVCSEDQHFWDTEFKTFESLVDHLKRNGYAHLTTENLLTQSSKYSCFTPNLQGVANIADLLGIPEFLILNDPGLKGSFAYTGHYSENWVYVNGAHPFVHSPYDSSKAFQLFSEFVELPTIRKRALDRKMSFPDHIAALHTKKALKVA